MANDEATRAHMEHPQPGDVFHEMFSFEVHVLAVADGVVTVREYPSSGEGKVRAFNTLDEFRRAYSYGNIPGYFIKYSGK